MTFPEDRSGPLPVKNDWLDATRARGSSIEPRPALLDEPYPAQKIPLPRTRSGITASPLVFASELPQPKHEDEAPKITARTGLRKPR